MPTFLYTKMTTVSLTMRNIGILENLPNAKQVAKIPL